MKRSMKKVLATVLAAASMLSMNMVMVTANAANTSDTSWSAPGEDTRQKDNDSSVYVKTSAEAGVYLSVYGRKLFNGPNVGVSTYGNSKLVTTNLTVPSNSQRLVKQFIHELNCQFAFIQFWNYPPDGRKASGVWSPDSVGKFDYAN